MDMSVRCREQQAAIFRAGDHPHSLVGSHSFRGQERSNDLIAIDPQDQNR